MRACERSGALGSNLDRVAELRCKPVPAGSEGDARHFQLAREALGSSLPSDQMEVVCEIDRVRLCLIAPHKMRGTPLSPVLEFCYLQRIHDSCVKRLAVPHSLVTY